MSEAILPPEYKTQWPALFVGWASDKLAEWEAQDRAVLSPAQQQKLDYDISALKSAIVRLQDGNKHA